MSDNPANYRLSAFSDSPLAAAHSVFATVKRRPTGIQASFRLAAASDGAWKDLSFSPLKPVSSRSRKDGLWQSTCFEIFLTADQSPAYLEYNLSPAGDWNVYFFSSYRQGMRSAPSPIPQMSMSQTEDGFLWEYEMATEGMEADHRAIIEAPRLSVGLTTVLATRDGKIAHLALAHLGEKPDFHQRKSFLITLS